MARSVVWAGFATGVALAAAGALNAGAASATSSSASSSTSPDWALLFIVAILVVDLAVVLTFVWRRFVRPRREVVWVSGHVTAFAGGAAGEAVRPDIQIQTEPDEHDHRFTWLPRTGTTRASIEEQP